MKLGQALHPPGEGQSMLDLKSSRRLTAWCPVAGLLARCALRSAGGRKSNRIPARRVPSRPYRTVARRVVTGIHRSLQLRVQLRNGTSKAFQSSTCGTGFPFNPLPLYGQAGNGNHQAYGKNTRKIDTAARIRTSSTDFQNYSTACVLRSSTFDPRLSSFTHIVLTFTNSRMPNSASSRP